jgi:hypothetical protein
MTELPPFTELVPLDKARRTEMLESVSAGLCAELETVRFERDALRAAVDRALHDLRNGCPEAALDVLGRAGREHGQVRR